MPSELVVYAGTFVGSRRIIINNHKEKMSQLSFIGKTAIITGAGGALGRAYAVDLAKRGCSLLINDVGATLIGTVTGDANAVGLSNAGYIQHCAILLI